MAAATEALARVGHAAPTAVDVAGDRAARKALIVKRVRQWSAVALLGIVWGGYNSIAAWRETHAFMINASESLPNWAFFIQRGRVPAKGDYVFFAPPEGELVRIIEPLNEKGKALLKSCKGVYVAPDLTVYIADENGRAVYQVDQDGKVLRTFEKPTHQLFGDKSAYKPNKVVLDLENILLL